MPFSRLSIFPTPLDLLRSRLPRPAPFNFDREGPAQERADDHQQAEYRDMVQGRLKSNGPDHIPGHQQLQSQQQRLAQLVLVALVGAGLVEFEEVANGSAGNRDSDNACHDHGRPQDLDDKGGPLDQGPDQRHRFAT
jgi:hypothetical protein